MTAGCKTKKDGNAVCNCPVFYGRFQLVGTSNTCDLGDGLVPSASYNPLLDANLPNYPRPARNPRNIRPGPINHSGPARTSATAQRRDSDGPELGRLWQSSDWTIRLFLEFGLSNILRAAQKNSVTR